MGGAGAEGGQARGGSPVGATPLAACSSFLPGGGGRTWHYGRCDYDSTKDLFDGLLTSNSDLYHSLMAG